MPQGKPQGRQKKLTEYGSQLQEKQKIRNEYGMREKPFRKIYAQAAKRKGATGQALLENLERRLDNVLFRAGFAQTRAQARQMVSHRHVKLNGKRVNIASISVSVGDVIEANTKEMINLRPETVSLDWLDVDKKKLSIKVKSLPNDSDLPIEFDTQKVIEFYSR